MCREWEVMDDRSSLWDDALCNQSDPETFFTDGEAATQKKAKAAAAICKKCPIESECLEYALEHEIHWGVWGGLTARQRRALLKKGNAA